MDKLADVGVIHGRFQPLHHGHMEYLLAGKKRCRYLIVGISNPDPDHTKYDPVCPDRSSSNANPFSYFDRLTMIRESLLEAHVSLSEFDIVPFPINQPALLHFYAPTRARYYVTVYDDWGKQKVAVLQQLNLEVEVMWQRSMSDRLTSGTVVRQLISAGGKWEHLVPRPAARVIYDWLTLNPQALTIGVQP